MLAGALEMRDQIVEWRREFHQRPELGFQENQTADRIGEVMGSIGYRLRMGVGGTGVVAEMGSGAPIVALRADMDALPIQEENSVPYVSQIAGVMHACGHDAHMAMALGAAALLSREEFPGTIRFLFQPAEEMVDDEGVSGASRMIEDGAMEGVQVILALHVDASLPVGAITIEEGATSAGVDNFSAIIRGRGGHGGMPQRTIDPIYIAGHVIIALHGIVSRRIRPHEPTVVSIGSIHGGSAENVIPEEVHLAGTLRFMTAEVQKKLHKEIDRALQIAQTMGAEVELNFERGSPPIVNDPRVTDLVREVAVELLGQEIPQAAPEMGAEDFSFFTESIPGAMFMLGCLIEGDERQHHNPRFDIDEDCLPIGTAVLAESILRLMRSGTALPN